MRDTKHLSGIWNVHLLLILRADGKVKDEIELCEMSETMFLGFEI